MYCGKGKAGIAAEIARFLRVTSEKPDPMTTNRIRALGLLSGGLDSTLAARLMMEQGLEVSAINFTSPFCTCTPKSAGCAAVVTAVRKLGGIPLKQVALGDDYLELVRQPAHGYGSGLNPCIDCRIMKLRKAGEYMGEIGAAFLFTGEILGQRPMSQQRHQLEIIDQESGMQGRILRPLSARHFAPTTPEQQGLVDRSKLLDISGRSRRAQIRLAAQKGITDYPCPAGGCLLTDKHFAAKMRDYFLHTEKLTMKDVHLLRVGRHFRLNGGDKVIVARTEHEGKTLENLCPKHHHLLVPVDFAGPVVALQGSSLQSAIGKMLEYTNRSVAGTDRIIHLYAGGKEILALNQMPLEIAPRSAETTRGQVREPHPNDSER